MFNKLYIGFMVKKDFSILAVHTNLKLKCIFTKRQSRLSQVVSYLLGNGKIVNLIHRY